ncbi:hypothetical protein K3495_g7977 [Podosphaera aphanis]|nr:hypothetical protein K3495_g7977 [Podosphaera aphanis]
MAGKRKRKRTNQATNDSKQLPTTTTEHNVQNSLLCHYYKEVVTLREYILNQLPPKSKIRRQKAWLMEEKKNCEKAKEFITFIDNTLVGVTNYKGLTRHEKSKQWDTFSQIQDETTILMSSSKAGNSQSDIVDFAIWLLFSKSYASAGRNQHLLCQGYRKYVAYGSMSKKQNVHSDIPGLYSICSNSHVASLKAAPWPKVLAQFGKDGDQAMVDLIINCGIYLPVGNSVGNYHQLSGYPLCNLDVLPREKDSGTNKDKLPSKKASRTPSNIKFIRNRMMYARGDLNSKGEIRFGLKRIHALNKFSIPRESNQDVFKSDESTTYILMYIFPRQFGLHNIFSDDTNSRQLFCDYTLREEEIKRKYPCAEKIKVPKRLRGNVLNLVRKIQILHKRCPYKKLLEHYCPIGVASKNAFDLDVMMQSNDEILPSGTSQFKTQFPISSTPQGLTLTNETEISSRKESMMDYATPTALIANIDWLCVPSSIGKLCKSDISKRWELFYEFIYYLFDSILIPLIQSNFYVTESNVHRYRVFYFRHDVWRSITEPALISLKSNQFEELPIKKAKKLLDSCAIGSGKVRLLPKETGVRPIMNLRKRTWKNGSLGRSINSILAPIHNVLTLEKNSKPERLGGSLFSVGDLYAKLKCFKSNLDPNKPLYFAKVDVQAAFDTIPQKAVLQMIRSIITEDEYQISRYVEMKPVENNHLNSRKKLTQKWTALAHYTGDSTTFSEMLLDTLSRGTKNTIFLENVVSKIHNRFELLSLLAQHIESSVVAIGKSFYRQKAGIPQGSVLSSLLCNYFYADLEAKHLSFLRNGQSLLLRLIDDFLLITVDASHAKRFLQIMHDGLPQYGVKVNPLKTLANFEVSINSQKISRVLEKSVFPYCGCLLDMKNLDISKDRERNKNMPISDSLTVEYSKTPGKIFLKKILNAFKLQTHAMYLDQAYNSRSTVLQNLHSALVETAMKTIAYVSCLPSKKRPGVELMKRGFNELVKSAELMVKRRRKEVETKIWNQARDATNGKVQNHVFRKGTIKWLALDAFCQVFRKNQTRYRALIEWFESQVKLLHDRHGRHLGKIKMKSS